MTLHITTHRLILEDGSEVFDLILDDGDGNAIRINLGSEEGANDIVANINNHAIDTVHHIETTTRY